MNRRGTRRGTGRRREDHALVVHGDLPIRQVDHPADQLRLAAFQQHCQFLVQLARAIHLIDGGQRSFEGQGPAGAHAAVQFVEVGLAPAGEKPGPAAKDLVDHRVGLAIESPVEQLGGIEKELVDGHAQAGGQFVQGPGVGLAAAQDSADGPLVEAGLLGELGDRQPRLGHQSRQVAAQMFRHGTLPKVAVLEKS